MMPKVFGALSTLFTVSTLEGWVDIYETMSDGTHVDQAPQAHPRV